MKCLNCGAELTDDTKFCSYCGAKIEQDEEMPSITKPTEQSDAANEYIEFDNSFYSEPTTNGEIKSNKYKEKVLGAWSKLSKFGKVATTGLSVFVILMLIAFLAGRIVAGIISIVQIAVIIAAILMKKNIIKVTYNWLSLVALAVSFILIIPYFSLFKINSADYVKYNWDEIILAEMLPKPESPYGEVVLNSDDNLSLEVTKTTATQYKEYIEACKDKGFTIDTETTGSFFYSFNDKGYKLSLSYYVSDSVMHINLDSAMEMETVTWPDSNLAKLLPVPKSTTGKIYSNDTDSFSVYIGNTTIDDYNDYVKACEDKGFTVDKQKKAKTFSAKNADSYKLSVDYKGNNVIYISVAEPEFDVTIEVECVENWIFSKYDVELSIDDDFEGTIPHGDKKSFDVVLKRGKHTISFESAEDSTLDGEIEVEITKVETVKLKVSCSSFGVDVELVSGTTAKDNASKETTSNTTESKSETELEPSGNTTETAKPSPVSYSTNDYETAKKGDSGVFSYKNKSGSYDIYWIINFDDGYVYWFTEGNGDSTCDKVKIVSGTLNDKIKVTWHDGGEEWSWHLHFKYVNNPVTLIVNDHNGFTNEFTTTDLDGAIELCNTKTIVEY